MLYPQTSHVSGQRHGHRARLFAAALLLPLCLASNTAAAENAQNGMPQDQYLAIPFPAEHPQDVGGAQLPIVGPADGLASPFGWHDTDGADGPEFTDTRGNNATVQTLEGFRPGGGPGPELLFDYPLDLGLPPDEGTNLEAGIVALFYTVDVLHDLTARYGFDEAAGNFQTTNYSGAGSGGDAVTVIAQRGIACDGFATPPDGSSPTQNSCVWQPNTGLVEVTSPGEIAGEIPAATSTFGPALDTIGIASTLALVDDGNGSPTDACDPLPAGSLAGLIAVIDRGSCEFGEKVLNAENAGATGAIVVNDQGDGLINMGPGAVGNQVTIPSLFIGRTDGDLLESQLPDPGVEATLRLLTDIPRDAAFDKGIVAHEYGHGISMRLTGGPQSVSCLNGDEQAGEGWSDFWHLVLTAKASDGPTTHRAIGTWVLGEPDDGPGLRNFPYTTDLALNPQTYGDLATANIPHGVGEIWATMVWEMYWELVLRHGFDTDLVAGTGGNNLAIQLVVDGLKLQPCGPSFVDARDAIIQADLLHTGGANQCAIWRAFAKRGLGLSAVAGSPNTVGDETEAFDLPAGCGTEIFADGFESGSCAAWSATSPSCG